MHAGTERGEQAHAAVCRGEISGLDARVAALGTTPIARAWALAIRGAASLLDPRTAAPSLGELAALEAGPPDARRPGALACSHVARSALLAHDEPSLRAVLEVHAALVRDVGEGTEGALALALGRAWHAFLAGDVGALETELAAHEREARAIGSAPLVIEAGALRALAAEAAGDPAASIAHARRTSRMARAESLPLHELIAGVVLARARRGGRHPHLALRILGALSAIAPATFHAWIGWESLLAGDVELPAGRVVSTTRAELTTGALARVLRAAIAGDARAMEAHASALLVSAGGMRSAEREAREVIAALDARAAIPDGEIAAWCRGRSILAPPSIHGLCTRIDDRVGEGDEHDDSSEAFVLASPDAAPRRVLGVGARLLDPGDRVRLRKTRRRQGRVETLIAVLASAGPEGLAEPECFALAYEVPYEAEVHRGVFDVLLTRARAYLGDAAEIVRGQGHIALRLRSAIVVPDPRCAAPVHDRLLRILAREGRATAADTARRIGQSVRAVQDALKTLAEEGACVGEKDGRQIHYAVEDTTFSEPTQRLALDLPPAARPPGRALV